MTGKLSDGMLGPQIDLPADGNSRFRLSDQHGKTVVLFFYPKDDTSGCTAEALAFSENKAAFAAVGAVVVGISPDSPAKHDKFKQKYKLSVQLASDETHSVLNEYGVWTEKTMYGRRYMGVERSTFILDGAGRVVRVWRNVKVPGHVDEVLAAVRSLS